MPVTRWVLSSTQSAVFALPMDWQDEEAAAWNQQVYLRIRSVEAAYPAFDLLSTPFVLAEMDYEFTFRLDTRNEIYEAEGSQVSVHLYDLGGQFGALQNVEASLFSGENPGTDLDAQLTGWMALENGTALISLPEDLSEGQTAPWNEQVYVRLRTGEGETYTFDVASQPFTLIEDAGVRSSVIILRGPLDLEQNETLFLPLLQVNAMVSGTTP